MKSFIDTSNLEKGLEALQPKFKNALRLYAETSAVKLQNTARSEAPWTDRTGHARQRLTGKAMEVSNGYKIALSQGVDYGKWLELANEKRFAILEPTIKKESPKILKGLGLLMDKMGG